MTSAAVAGIWGDQVPDCRTCATRDPASRAAWGCDQPADAPVWWAPCDECPGADCERCGGSGKVARYRCPGRELASHPPHAIAHINRAMTAYSQYHGRHVLPAAGGWADQSTGFAELVGYVDGQRGWWEEQQKQRESEREKRAKSAQVQAALYGGGPRRG